MSPSRNIVILNQELLREKLRQKQYDDVCLSSWGHLDEFINFIISFGVLAMLSQLGLNTGHSGIPCTILALLAFLKPLFGIRFDDNVKYLFQDQHVLRLLGFNIQQIKNGFSKRTKSSISKPIHPNSLRNFLCNLGYKETTGLFVKVTRKLFKLGLIRGHLFCTDTKVIFKDSPGYEFAKKVFDYKGKHKNRRGYKVSIVQHIKSRFVVAVIITSANVADKNLLLTTIKHAVTVLGPGVIRTMVFDKGYWDGKTLTRLKEHYGIDFIIPAKDNFLITKRLKQEAKGDDYQNINPGLQIKQVKGITDAPNYKGELQAILVKDQKAKKKRKTTQPVHVYVTSLAWNHALTIYMTYRKRWVIENNAIKELCQYWSLEDFHCSKFNSVRAHILFSIVMFNLHLLFKSKHGRRFYEKNIAAKRLPGFQPVYVIVYWENYFGIFDIQEYTLLLSQPP